MSEARESGFLLSLAGIAVGAAGAQASAVASQNYSLLSGALQAGEASFDREVLAEQAMSAIISQMRAERARVRARIYTSLGGNVTKYPLQAAISDIESYRQAGTLLAGLISMNNSAQLESAAAQRVSNLNADHFNNVITGVARVEEGNGYEAEALTAANTRRSNEITAKIEDGEITKAKIVEFLTSPPQGLSDEMRASISEIADSIRSSNGTDPASIQIEDLTRIYISRIQTALADFKNTSDLDIIESTLLGSGDS